MSLLEKKAQICQLEESFEDENNFYLILEYCDGKNLVDILASTNLKEYEVRSIFKNLLKGLHTIHSFNVAHRDIKCDNLIVNERKELKIIDFGFAC